MNQPPRNEELEKSLLGCLLHIGGSEYSEDKQVIYTVEMLGGEKLFYTTKHQLIYKKILDVIEEPFTTDIIAAGLNMDGVRSYLMELQNSQVNSLLAEYYARELKNLYLKRELRDVCNQTIYEINNKQIPAVELINSIGGAVVGLSKQDKSITRASLSKLSADLWEQYIENEGQPPSYMRTGLADLDYYIDGIEHTEHIIIAGRPSTGKTALATDIARAIARQGKIVDFFTMEMSETALTRRLVCAEAGVSLRRYRNGKLEASEKERVGKTLSKFGKWNLNVIEGRVTVTDIRSHILQSEPDLVIVDYLQLMPIDRKSGISTNDLVGDNIIGLQGVAKTGPAVITLSQLSRSSDKERRRPRLDDLLDSGKIEAAGDKILATWCEDKEATEREILVLKQKDGPVGYVDVAFLPEPVTFRDLSKYN